MDLDNIAEQPQERWMQAGGKFVPKQKCFYFRNHHGKVVVLNEQVALEQFGQHAKYYGNSDDLFNSGWDYTEALVKHLENNVPNPTPPRDLRRENPLRKQPQAQVGEADILNYLLKNKEKVKELLKD